MREITRFCLERRLRSRGRLEARDALISGLVDYALTHGISTYTGVAAMGWFQQILAFGWRCRALGIPLEHDGDLIAALRITIDAETKALMADAGIYRQHRHDVEARHAA